MLRKRKNAFRLCFYNKIRPPLNGAGSRNSRVASLALISYGFCNIFRPRGGGLGIFSGNVALAHRFGPVLRNGNHGRSRNISRNFRCASGARENSAERFSFVFKGLLQYSKNFQDSRNVTWCRQILSFSQKCCSSTTFSTAF